MYTRRLYPHTIVLDALISFSWCTIHVVAVDYFMKEAYKMRLM